MSDVRRETNPAGDGEPLMIEYRVDWAIDLDANGPLHAAQQAAAAMLKWSALVFWVTDPDGNRWEVDLADRTVTPQPKEASQ